MAVVAGRTQLQLKDTTNRVTVPENNRARLMFYLNCLCVVLKLDDPQINRLTQYNNYHLSDEQTDALIALCCLLSHDVLLDKYIFHTEQLCGDLTNKYTLFLFFFQTGAVQFSLGTFYSVVIITPANKDGRPHGGPSMVAS